MTIDEKKEIHAILDTVPEIPGGGPLEMRAMSLVANFQAAQAIIRYLRDECATTHALNVKHREQMRKIRDMVDLMLAHFSAAAGPDAGRN